ARRAGQDRGLPQCPRGRGAASPRRAPRHGRDRSAALHLRAHGPLAREEPPAQARRLVPPRGSGSAQFRARSLKITHGGGCESPTARARGADTQTDTILLKVFRSAVALCFLGDTAGLQKGPAASFGESFASSINQGRQRARVVAALQNGGETWAELGRAARELPEAVAVVDVPIDDRHAPDPELGLGVPRSDRDVVEQAEAHRATGQRVVAGRADEPEADPLHGLERTTSREERRLPACLRGDRVRVEQGRSLDRLEPVEIRRLVTALYLFTRGRPALDDVERLQQGL